MSRATCSATTASTIRTTTCAMAIFTTARRIGRGRAVCSTACSRFGRMEFRCSPIAARRASIPTSRFGCWKSTARTVGLYPPTALKVLREVSKPREKYQHLKLRCIVSGAEPVSPQLAKWVDEELQVEFNQAFGQTEANYFIGTSARSKRRASSRWARPYPGHDVTIVSPEGVPVKTGESGEIAIRRDSPVVMREYWKNPAAMNDKFKGEWCMTGDLGHMDDEGYVYFAGRNDDVIKSSGYRIGPSEIEAKIMEHKSVASCAVIGVPDPQRGQAIKAFVKLLPGFKPSDEMIKEIQMHVKTRLAAHEAPREFEFMDEFPSTVTGKIMRRELRAREEARLGGKRR